MNRTCYSLLRTKLQIAKLRCLGRGNFLDANPNIATVNDSAAILNYTIYSINGTEYVKFNGSDSFTNAVAEILSPKSVHIISL